MGNQRNLLSSLDIIRLTGHLVLTDLGIPCIEKQLHAICKLHVTTDKENRLPLRRNADISLFHNHIAVLVYELVKASIR